MRIVGTAGEVILPAAVKVELAGQIAGWSTNRPVCVHIELVPALQAEQWLGHYSDEIGVEGSW